MKPAAVLGFAMAWASAMPAMAQVIEIGSDGAVVRHDGPAVYLTADLKPQPIETGAAQSIRRAAAPARPTTGAIGDAIDSSASAHSLSAALIKAVAWRESRFRSSDISPRGAIGVMQLMPATARALGVDPRQPAANIEGGTSFLASLLRRYNGDIVRALAAYNAGPGAVDRYGGVPPFRETRAYVADILDHLSQVALDER